MLSPFVILSLQIASYSVAALLLIIGVIWYRRISTRNRELAKENAEASHEKSVVLAQKKKMDGVGPLILLMFGFAFLVLPFTGVLQWDFDRIVRNYKKKLEYRAPRIQKEYDSTPNVSLPSSLTKARENYQTRLRKKIAAPQDASESLVAPSGAKLITYSSGDLSLKAWVSEDPGDGKTHPAIVFLHGGFALGQVDWDDLQQYRDAGYITMTPSLRGENGNPGNFEFFYGEVGDALAAGEFTANLPYVDPKRVHVTGHSIGGLLSVMTAESESVFRSAIAFSPTSLDTAEWIEEIVSGKYKKQGSLQDPDLLVFNHKSEKEVTLRNPHEFASRIQVPLLIYLERGRVHSVSDSFSYIAKENGRPLLLKQIYGTDHMTMLKPAIKDTISWFKFLEMADPETLTSQNIARAYAKRESDTSEIAEFLSTNRPKLNEQAYRQLRYGMSEIEVEELLGKEGHYGAFDRSPRLEEIVKQQTAGVLERKWYHDSGSMITTHFDTNGKLAGHSMSGSDPFFRGKFDEISASRKDSNGADQQGIDDILSESTFAIIDSHWKYKVWTSDSQVFVAQMDEENKLDSLRSYPSIRIDYREFRGVSSRSRSSRD